MGGIRRRFDSAALASGLTSVAQETRLRILDTLRSPMTTSDLVDALGCGGLELRRQSVTKQVQALVEAGLVITSSINVAGRPRARYETDAERLFHLAETLRTLGSTFTLSGDADDRTLTLADGIEPVRVHGPHLAILHGVEEGAVFPLAKRLSDGRRWTFGRGADATHTVAGDKTISRMHAVVSQDLAGRFTIEPMAGARNATLLNWLPLDAPARLRVGDLVGMGRTKLVFRDGP